MTDRMERPMRRDFATEIEFLRAKNLYCEYLDQRVLDLERMNMALLETIRKSAGEFESAWLTYKHAMRPYQIGVGYVTYEEMDRQETEKMNREIEKKKEGKE